MIIEVNIQQAITLSLIITVIYFSFQEGNIFGNIKWWVDKKIDKICFIDGKGFNRKHLIFFEMIQKPLWGCLPCMGFWWTALLTWNINIQLMLVVAGINVIISKFINWE